MSNKAPLYGFSAADGIHRLKDKWSQKSHIGVQSQYLLEHMQDAIDATFDKAPCRKGNFKIVRDPTKEIDPKSRERLWERSLLTQWKSDSAYSIPDCWHRLLAFQVPLAESGHNEKGWGAIDLLGVEQVGRPVVVELKKDPPSQAGGRTGATETPMRMVLEGWAYAIALKKCWSYLRPELENALKGLDEPPDKLCVELKSVRIVAAAPASFWIDWLPVTKKGQSGVSPDDWRQFRKLIAEMADAGFDVSFVSISGDSEVPDTLAAQPLPYFPMTAISSDVGMSW